MKKTWFFALAIFFLGAGAAYADVVVVVGARNSVPSLNDEQVAQIFLGKVGTFPGAGRAVPLDLDEGNPARAEFYRKVTGKDAAQLKAYWAKQIFTGRGQPPKAVPSDAEAKKLLADDPGLIGYIEKSSVDSSVRVVYAP